MKRKRSQRQKIIELDPILITSKRGYRSVILIGGIISIVVGIIQLLYPFVMDKGGVPNWYLALFFLPFGFLAIVTYLDHLKALVYSDKIEIQSVFRKRIILKKDIIGYGVEDYKGEHTEGERIRIIHKNGNTKFHTTQFEDIEALKKFVKGKKEIPGAFRRDRVADFTAITLCFFMIFSPLFFVQDTELQKENDQGVLESIGIPATINKDLRIISENEEAVYFQMEDYVNYTFGVKKENAPANFSSIKEEVIIFFDDKVIAQELSNSKGVKISADPPRTIFADQIEILMNNE